jgi:hypothetical protein
MTDAMTNSCSFTQENGELFSVLESVIYYCQFQRPGSRRGSSGMIQIDQQGNNPKCAENGKDGSLMSYGIRAASVLYLSICIACEAAAAPTQAPDLKAEDLTSLLLRLEVNEAANWKLFQQYTFDEFLHNTNFHKDGKVGLDYSVKYEHIFVEGLPYRRIVESNGKLLTGKAAKAEKKFYEDAVRERQDMSIEEKRKKFYEVRRSAFPMCCLAALFENRVEGHETIDGRDTVIVESVPRADANPANDYERSSLVWKEIAWIDTQDAMVVRAQEESLVDQGHILKGAKYEIVNQRVVDTPASEGQPEKAVWVPKSSVSHFSMKMEDPEITGTTEQTYSNFKKFHVDVRLLYDTMQVLPEPAAAPTK